MRGARLRGSRALLFALVAATVAFSGALAASAKTPGPTTLRVGYPGFPDYIDPQLSYTTEGWTATYDTYIPLLTFRHADGRAGSDVVPGLAKRLPRVSDDRKTYTLFMRRELMYSDGTPVQASDFEHAIERLFRTGSGAIPFYRDIVGVRQFQRTRRGGIRGIVTNDATGRVVIHLRRPLSTFANLLALPFAAPVPSDTPMRDLTFRPPPATGPYVITDIDPRGWTYIRNPAWEARNARLMPRLPRGHVDRIEVRIVRNADARLRQVIEGRLDWAVGQIPADRYAELQREYGGSQLRTEPTLSTYYFWMNTTKAPFSDLRVREAANYAVDRTVLAEIYAGQLVPSQQILPPGMPGYRQYALFPYDLEKARRLVAAADPADRTVTVWADSGSPDREAAAYYRAQLQNIGLRASLKFVGSLSYFTEIGNRSTPDLDTGWANWFADYPHPDDFFQPTLLGTSILPFNNGNFAQLAVPALDSQIEKLSRRPLGPAQERSYATLDRRYMERAPWVPYGSLTLSTFVSKRVDLDSVAWNPLIGPDLASFRLQRR